MASRVLSRMVRGGGGVVHRLISGPSRQHPAGSSSSLIKCSSYQMDQSLRQSNFFGVISQHIGFSSSASPEHTDKEVGHQDNAPEKKAEVDTTTDQSHEADLRSKSKNSNTEPGKRRKSAQRTGFSSSDAKSDLSFDDLVNTWKETFLSSAWQCIGLHMTTVRTFILTVAIQIACAVLDFVKENDVYLQI